MLFAQAPAIEWQNRIGGVNLNYSYNSQKTNDGGFIVGGRSNSDISGDKSENSRGGFDYWIAKVNSLGIVEWDKTIGGGNPNGWEQDVLYKLKKTTDNGYIICGSSQSPISGDKIESSVGGSDFWIVKLDSNGNIVWQNTIGGTNNDVPYSIELASDGGYVIGGYSESNISGDKTENCRGLQDYWIVKLNGIGDIQWERTFGGSGNDILNNVKETTDGGYFLSGRSNSDISGDKNENSKGSSDYWIIKLDNVGNQLWQKTIGGSDYEELGDIIQTSDNGFLLTGSSYSSISGDKTEISRGFNDFWVVKINNSGAIQWQKTIGGNNQDNLFSASICSDGGYLLAGTSISPISGDKTDPAIGGYDGWIVKINSTGGILWQKTIGGSSDDGFNSVVQTNNNGYFLSGGTSSPISGDIIEGPIGSNDYWIMKLAPDNLSVHENELNNGLTLYPNPVKNNLNIETKDIIEIESINIYNALGQLLQEFSNTQSTKLIDVSNLASGNYFVKIRTGKGILTSKFIKK